MNSKLFYLLPLLAVVVISGCTIGPDVGVVGGNDVVKITDIKFSSNSLTSLQTLTIDAIVKNADTILTNPAVQTKVRLSKPSCGVESVKTVCPSGSQEIQGSAADGWGCSNLNLQPIGENQGGERIQWKVSFSNPSNLKNIEEPNCGFQIVTDYDYETVGLTKVDFEDYQTFRSDRQRERKEPIKGTGPVKVYFQLDELQPYLINRDKKEPIIFVFHLENAKSPSGNEIETRIPDNSVTITDINLFEEMGDGTCNIDGHEKKISKSDKLEVKDNKVITCTVSTPIEPAHKEIVVKGKYNYQIVYRTDGFSLTYK